MKKLRIGIIGCGEITKFMLLLAKFNKDIKIVGCADIKKMQARKYAMFFKGAKAYGDYKEMVGDLHPDAVYIAVPHYLHYPMMMDLINKGIHILCEKPITTDTEDAKDVIRQARKENVKVGVNYQYRYDKACYRMVMAARNGDLGKLYYGICNLPWRRGEKYFAKSSWHAIRESSGGGTLITQGSHGLDILLQAFGNKPLNAYGVSRNLRFDNVEVEDLCMGTVELEGGPLLQINSSMIAKPGRPMTIQIYGSEGTAFYKGWDLFSKVSFSGVKVPDYQTGIKGIHALEINLKAFKDWVLFDTPYLNKAENSVPVLSVVQAVYRSAASRKTEKIDL